MERFSRYQSAARLPLFLTALFVVQNLVFNFWVHLTPNPQVLFLILESFTLGVLLYGPAILLRARVRFAYLFSISLVVSLIFISQYLYFSFYGGFLQASALRYASQLNAEWSTVSTLLTPRILLFLLNVFAVLLAFTIPRKEQAHMAQLFKHEKLIVSAVCVAIVTLGYGIPIAYSANGWQKIIHPSQTLHELNSFTFSPDQTVQEIGICNYYLGDIIGTLSRSIPVTQDDVLFVEQQLKEKPALTRGPRFGIARGDNLIFIQVESLDDAVIGEKIGDQEITPNLNALSKKGLYFDNYYTQIGPGNTADAEFVTLNSLYPLTNTVAFIDFAHNTYDALPDLLTKNGYHTYALHGDVPDFWNRANIYPSLGYEDQISKNAFTSTEAGFETLDDDDFLSQSAQKMSGFQDPFMATVITLSSHTPFIIPEKYQALRFPPGSPLSERQKNYLQSLHYTDSAVGAFIDALKSEGLYAHSLIAIYGDHGSSTGIESQIGTTTDTTLQSLSNSHVPLILLSPALNASLKGTVTTPGSHLDLYPTVANLLGLKAPKDIFGQDLLSTKTPVVTHRDPYSGIILTILTPKIAFEGATSGLFADGSCVQLPERTALPLADCQALYDQQAAHIQASDLIIRGNLLPSLSQK